MSRTGLGSLIGEVPILSSWVARTLPHRRFATGPAQPVPTRSSLLHDPGAGEPVARPPPLPGEHDDQKLDQVPPWNDERKVSKKGPSEGAAGPDWSENRKRHHPLAR